MRIGGFSTDRRGWQIFVDRLCLWLGTALLLAGAIYFIAYNWQEMGRFLKLGCSWGLILATLALAYLKGVDSVTGRTGVFAAVVLVGVFLAVFGQIYQTGADVYELFAGWALLSFGVALVSRFGPTWVLWLVVANTGAALYFEQILNPSWRFETSGWWFLLLSVVNLAAYLLWKLRFEGVDRWSPRVVVSGAMGLFVVCNAAFIARSFLWGVVPLAVLVVLLVLAYRVVRDLYFLTLVLFAGIFAISALFARGLADADALFIVSLTAIGLSAVAVHEVRKRQLEWREADDA
jgi:uncharacterized membrane protein